jgi:transcriptional regulator with XRE-family HTH domain
MSLQDVANKLNVSKQTVNKWEKSLRPIPEARLKQLSEEFKIPEEYFQKELDDIDKLKIQKIKLNNEITFIEEVKMFDLEEINEIYKLDTEIEKKKLIIKIQESFDKSNIDTSSMIRDYEILANLFISNKVTDEKLIREVLGALKSYFGGKGSLGFTAKRLREVFEEREEKKKK